MQYNIDIFDNLKNIYKKNIYGGSMPIEHSDTEIYTILREFTRSNNADGIIAYFNEDPSRLLVSSESNSIVHTLLYLDGLDPNNKIKIFEYILGKNEFELFQEANFYYGLHPYSILIQNILLVPYSSEKMPKYIKLLQELLDNLTPSLQDLSTHVNRYKYITCLLESVNFISFIHKNNKSDIDLFMRLISQELLVDCHKKFAISLKENIMNIKFEGFFIIFDFIWKTSEITIDFLIDVFTVLFAKVKTNIERSLPVNINLYDLYEYLISADNSKGNKDKIFSANKDGTTLLHIMFTTLSINDKNEVIFASFYDIYSRFYGKFIELFSNELILSKNNKGVGATILHNALFYKCPFNIIDYLLKKEPQLISLSDSKRKYPIFYVAEIPSNIEIFNLILGLTPPELCHIQSENNKIPLEYIMKNLIKMNYERDMIEPFIFENNHLPLINTIEKYTIIEAMGLYNISMRFKNKTLLELISYFWNKLERDNINTTASRKLKELYNQLQPNVISDGTAIHLLELDKHNCIDEYLTALSTEPYNLNSPINEFRIKDEVGVDDGGVERTMWKHIIDDFKKKYCTELENKIYFKKSLKPEDWLNIGLLIGRSYRYGPKIRHGDDFFGGNHYTYSSISIIDIKMASIISVGLFEDIPEEIIEQFAKAQLKPDFSIIKERFYLLLISYLKYGDPSGVLLTHEGKTKDEVITHFINYIAPMLGIDDNKYFIEAFKNLILNDTHDELDPLFNNFVKQFTSGGIASDNALNTIKMEQLFESIKLTEKLDTKVYNKIREGYAYDTSEPIRELIHTFFDNKHIIIRGINQIIFGFFDVDIRRIMKINLKPIPITLKGLKKKILLKKSNTEQHWSPDFMEMDQREAKNMALIINKVLNKLHAINALPKFVMYFSGIPLILSHNETYTILSYIGDLINVHTCYNRVDFPSRLITRENIDIAVDLLMTEILKGDATYNSI